MTICGVILIVMVFPPLFLILSICRISAINERRMDAIRKQLERTDINDGKHPN